MNEIEITKVEVSDQGGTLFKKAEDVIKVREPFIIVDADGPHTLYKEREVRLPHYEAQVDKEIADLTAKLALAQTKKTKITLVKTVDNGVVEDLQP